MIAYNPKEWFGLIFRFHRAETFRKLFWVMVFIAIYSAIISYIELEVLALQWDSKANVHGLLGFIISLLLVFRTNTAYDRWWEGRKQWGSLVNVSRNLAIKIDSVVAADATETRKRFQALIGAYATALRDHLRNKPIEEVYDLIPDFLRNDDGLHGHGPNAIAQRLQKEIKQLRSDAEIGEAFYLALLNDVSQFTDICGACERIKKTPIPYTYNTFIKKFIFAYIVTMPIGFVFSLGYFCIPVTVLTFYALASLEMIAEEIEDPFGYDSNDLPTDELAKTIGKNVGEILNVPMTV
ncbi:MAG: hypothetical protein NXI22_01405 [bacterium]|nr:hypothetical protein [bacterium]